MYKFDPMDFETIYTTTKQLKRAKYKFDPMDFETTWLQSKSEQIV